MDYKYSVPIMNLTVNAATRDEYLCIRRHGADG